MAKDRSEAQRTLVPDSEDWLQTVLRAASAQREAAPDLMTSVPPRDGETSAGALAHMRAGGAWHVD